MSNGRSLAELMHEVDSRPQRVSASLIEKLANIQVKV